MIRNGVILAVVWLLSSSIVGQDSTYREWGVKGKEFKARFFGQMKGKLLFRTGSGSLERTFDDLTIEDQLIVCIVMNWGRVWLDSTRQHTMPAEIVGIDDDEVILEGLDGRRTTVPLDRLSDEDREFAEQQRERLGNSRIANVLAEREKVAERFRARDEFNRTTDKPLPQLTRAMYEGLEIGISHEQATRVMSWPGTELQRTPFAGVGDQPEPIETVKVHWAHDGIGFVGIFQNDKLVLKSQVGLR